MTQRLGLSRSTLLSLFTICAVLVLFATGATFALSTSDDASGTVTAGAFIASLNVIGTGTGEELVFTVGASDASCPAALLPGDTCYATVNVTNDGNLPLTVAQPVTTPPYNNTAHVVDSQTPTGCLDSHWPVSVGNVSDATLAPGESTSFLVSVTLSLTAPQGCQNESATVLVTVDATN